MLEIEIDGKKAQVPDGSTVMDAAQQLGVYVPHFCYHKKLSIAANCRMCLVQVEKAPKPLPACATPVTNGMKVFTHSELAVKAQQGVMEFLLINHPLDCPICDQGGECQLQDLAVGYGGTKSRYTEEKRVVFHKNVGPLISMEEMSRCIHCTRCVRFGQEIAGVMELGMANRNLHSEIMTFVGRSVDSELSGNMIDLCPVGALTSKPFRYAARTWELQRRKSVSPHDSVGANLVVQVKGDRVMRVLPRENDEVNECWISDKDRFSYEALNRADRLQKPMVKQGGSWHEVEWNVALDYVAHGFKDIVATHGPAALGALASPHATVEELYLLQKLVRGLGSDNVDFRLRQSDFRADGKRLGVPWLGLPLNQIGQLDGVLVVGSEIRKDHPLIAHRLRQAAKKGTALGLISFTQDDPLLNLAARAVVRPSALAGLLAGVVKSLAQTTGAALPAGLDLGTDAPSAEAAALAAVLLKGERKAVFLGNGAVQHPDYAALETLAAAIAQLAGASLGTLGEAANSVGGFVARALPQQGGLNARAMLETPRQAYLLAGAEPEFDFADPTLTVSALKASKLVVYLTSFQHPAALDFADVILPVAPFTETSGTYINTEGRVQTFAGVVRPLGDTRPAWKVLRVLGNLLQLAGFDYESSEQVRNEALGGEALALPMAAQLGNGLNSPVAATWRAGALERVGITPIHFADALSRRAPALQQTTDAKAPALAASPATLAGLGLKAGDTAVARQGQGSARLPVVEEAGLPEGSIRIAAGHGDTAGLGSLYGDVTVERA